jgi:hypothetical protein
VRELVGAGHQVAGLARSDARFNASASGADTVSLKLAKPSKLHLTLFVRAGDLAADGLTLGSNVTFKLQ